MKGKVLIVEDQFIEANNLQMILERAGYQVIGIAHSVPVALQLMESEIPNLVLLDIFLKGPLTGIDLARTLREKNVAFVYLSANSNAETLMAAKETHPYGFLVKPFREKDVLVMLEIAHYQHAHNLESMLRNKNVASFSDHQKALENSDGNFRGIIGKSPKLAKVLRHLQLVAPTDTSVLILGESGTGKERVAECIHELSERKKNTLVKVNCATLPTNLIESILFGHEKGAFTGATERRIGKFEQANESSLFLDEIGELNMDVQSKLLRVLQEKEIERIGGNSTIKINVRIIAATNRNLEKEVADGRFRIDLYYRLIVFPLLLPALRERKEDIPLLVDHFIKYFADKNGRKIEPLSSDLMHTLVSHSWPGNVRELAHSIERAIVLAETNRIKEIPLPIAMVSEQASTARVKTMEENERDHIIAVLRQCNGKIFGKGGAAELLGMNHSTLTSRIKKLGIEKETLFRTLE